MLYLLKRYYFLQHVRRAPKSIINQYVHFSSSGHVSLVVHGTIDDPGTQWLRQGLGSSPEGSRAGVVGAAETSARVAIDAARRKRRIVPIEMFKRRAEMVLKVLVSKGPKAYSVNM